MAGDVKMEIDTLSRLLVPCEMTIVEEIPFKEDTGALSDLKGYRIPST
jgi:hypothetical protein